MHLHIFKDKRKEWRWSAIAPNNKAVAGGGEGYKNRKSMMKNLVVFLTNAAEAARLAYEKEYPNG